MRLLAATSLALALTACLATTAQADPPTIGNIVPSGVQRGVATEVTISGGSLDANPQLLAPFATTVEPPATAGDGGNFRLKLTVAADVPVGVYPVRVKTDRGVSNPFLLAVGQFPNVAEVEPNGAFEQAQAIAVPAVVEGQASGSDVDYFKFAGKKGQRVLIDAQCARIGSGVDPQVRLTTAGRAFVASADDSAGLMTDARLAAELPEDGEYVVEISDTKYQGGGRAVYRLVVGAVPAAEEVYPLGGRRGETVGLELRGGTLPGDGPRVAAATVRPEASGDAFLPRITDRALGLAGPGDATAEVELPGPLDVSESPELREPADPAAPPIRAAAPVVLNGRIETPGDEDKFELAVVPGQGYRVDVHAADLGSSLDGTLTVATDKGAALGNSDDTAIQVGGRRNNRRGLTLNSPDPFLEFAAPADAKVVVLTLRDLAGRGGVGYPYRIVVEPATPAVSIEMAESQLNVPKGGTAALPVTLGRQGYNGPLTLSVANPPPGLSVRAGQVADGQPLGVLSVSASPDAAFGVVELMVEGRADGPSGPIVERATKQVVFAQQQNMPVNLVTQTGLPASPAEPTPVTLGTPEAPIEAVHGYSANIPVTVARTEGADAGLSITPLPLPPGLGVPELKIADKANEGTATVSIDPGTALGRVSIGLVGKGKFGDKDRTIAAPVVLLEVVRPAGVELAMPNLEIHPGQTVELKGKLIRRGPFKEPVKVTLTALPGGLKCDPVDVAPDASEFTLKVVAEEGAAAAEATAQVALAYQVAGKDYPNPPAPLPLKVVK
jgi:hypothetical protein